MNIEQRVEDLESKVAFQDDLIHALNEVVAKQRLELDRIQSQFKELAEIWRGMQSQIKDIGDEAPPPHY